MSGRGARGPGEGGWRLLRDGLRDGAWNMAVDEALLDARLASAEPAPPTLRLYGWDPPALSLGYRQPPVFDPDYLERQHIESVRRPTGGLAVLHEHERTYSVCGNLRCAVFPGGVIDTYRRVAAALTAGLRELGVDAQPASPKARSGRPTIRAGASACFDQVSTHEIAVGGRKLLGSAQLRRRGTFLQHGSLPVTFDAERTRRALGTGQPIRATGLSELLGRRPDDDEIDRALVQGFAATFGVPLVPSALTDHEHLRAVQLYSWKYSSLAWTLEGRYGERERRWGPI